MLSNCLRSFRQNLHFRQDWLALSLRISTTTFLGWNARVLGQNISLNDGTVVEDFAQLLLSASHSSREYIRIGKGCVIRTGAQVHSWGGFVEIGDDCTVNANTVIYGTGGVRIGDHVRVAANSVLVASSHIYTKVDIPITQQGFTAKGIAIDDDCWIGSGVCILDGVRVGRGAVVGAGSVVRKDVEPFSIVAGTPAKLIRRRGEVAPDLSLAEKS